MDILGGNKYILCLINTYLGVIWSNSGVIGTSWGGNKYELEN